MIKEKSCGGVVINNESKVLLVKHTAGHYSFPKGHVENNETEEQTAIREIKEETNVDVIVNTSIKEKITYSPYKGCIKDVIFFLCTPTSNNIINQEEEVTECSYYTYNDALKIITYDSDKEVLKKIYLKYLEENINL